MSMTFTPSDNDTPTGHGTLSDDIKVTYGDVSISDEYIKSIPKDNVNDEIFYPSGASVGQEGFDE